MDYPESYELIFQAGGAEDDVVVVHLTARSGAGGYPVYEDETGIVRAEIEAGAARCACRRAAGIRSWGHRCWPGR